MWWQLFIVFVAISAASANVDENSCRRLIDSSCETEDGPPYGLPVTGEELETFCNYYLNYFECAKNVTQSCEGLGDNTLEQLNEMITTFRRVCKEDSLLRNDVVANLPCYEKNEEIIGSCPDDIDIDSFAENLKEIGITDIEELGDSRSRCLNFLFSSACLAARTGQLCGDVARDIVLNITQGFDSSFKSCPAGAKEKIAEITNMVQREGDFVDNSLNLFNI